MVTSDPLSRCVGGLPLLKEAGPECPLEWGGVGGVWLGVGVGGAQILYVKSPQGKCAATEGKRAALRHSHNRRSWSPRQPAASVDPFVTVGFSFSLAERWR